MRKSVPGFAVLLAAAAVSYSIVTGGAIVTVGGHPAWEMTAA